MQFDDGLQIIIQTQRQIGQFECEGFSSFPIAIPTLITIAAVDTPIAHQWAEELRLMLTTFLTSLGQGTTVVKPWNIACGGSVTGLFNCHAHSIIDATKLLVLVGDPAQPFNQILDYEQWVQKKDSYHVLPIFPRGANVSQLLPSSTLSLRNAAFWDAEIAEVLPEVLAVAGLSAEENRIFISYYRPDTQPLAEQLFDALTHVQFDVYLDRFRTPPGVNFQQRLEQELLDKALILVLESPNLPRSRWCQHEISYAIRHRLGILALQLPRAPMTPSITAMRRQRLRDHEMDNLNRKLWPKVCDRVVNLIKQEHARALIHRRQYIQRSMLYALAMEGVDGSVFGVDSLLRAHSVAPSARSYALKLTTRSPQMIDFFKTDRNLSPHEQGVVLGPGIVEKRRRERLMWLSNKSRILIEDESRLINVARDIARGTL